MKAFATLYARLDATTSSNAKLIALQEYFSQADATDAAWAVYFLAGGRPRQLVPSKILREITLKASNLPEWLFDESYQSVGDLAETMTLLIPKSMVTSDDSLADWLEHKLLPLRGIAPEMLTAQLLPLLQQLDKPSQLVCIKLITGSFRVGVSKLLVTRALAAVAGIDAKRIAQRLVGYTDLSARPTAAHYLQLIAPITENGDERSAGQPYPFFLAHSLQAPTDQFEALIGNPDQWLVEWKWDGIRSQLVKRDGQLWIWSRGEDLVTDRFPELNVLADYLPDGTVIDGEIVVWKDNQSSQSQEDLNNNELAGEVSEPIIPAPVSQEPGNVELDNIEPGDIEPSNIKPVSAGQVQPFALLQQRIGRKTLTAKILENIPVVILAYDLLACMASDSNYIPLFCLVKPFLKLVCNRL